MSGSRAADFVKIAHEEGHQVSRHSLGRVEFVHDLATGPENTREKLKLRESSFMC